MRHFGTDRFRGGLLRRRHDANGTAAIPVAGNGLPGRDRLLSDTVANMGEDVAVIRADAGTVAYVNPSWGRHFGYDPDALVGRHVSSLLAPMDERSPGQQLHAIMVALQRDGVWRGSTRCVREDGTTVMRAASIAEFDAGPESPYWVIVVTHPSAERA